MNSNGRQGEHSSSATAILYCSERDQMRQTGALAGVRDLIVILNERDKAVPRQVSRGTSEVALPKRRVATVVNKTFGNGLLNVPQLAKPGEIGAIRTGQVGADRMMEFIEPLGVDGVPASRVRIEDANIVEIAFGDDPRLSPQVARLVHETGREVPLECGAR